MSAYKQFLSSDVIVTPFEVNKRFYFEGSSAFTGSNVGIDRYLGENQNTSLFNPLTSDTTGQITTQYQTLIYNSIKQLYYGNNLGPSNYGSPVVTASLVPGRDTAGDVYVGTTSSAGRYFIYPQTTLTFQKTFPTESSARIGVISIPAGIYGNFIQPNSFYVSSSTGLLTDDGEGNLLYNGSLCGNIFYEQGLAVLTTFSSSGDGTFGVYGSGSYGVSLYGYYDAAILDSFILDNNITCSFSSSFTIYESQYKCTIRENEYNFSLNPSIISGSTDGTPYGFVTESYFSPYVTTVGLYDEDQNLLAIGKLAQPLPTSPTTDTTILINIDR
jgi:hypothetical protein